jgi:hypothetical protein
MRPHDGRSLIDKPLLPPGGDEWQLPGPWMLIGYLIAGAVLAWVCWVPLMFIGYLIVGWFVLVILLMWLSRQPKSTARPRRSRARFRSSRCT